MGHWANDRQLKELRRIQESNWLARKPPPVRLGLLRSTGVPAAEAIKAVERVHRKRGVAAVVAVGTSSDWDGLYAWCWACGIDLSYAEQDALLRMKLDGLVSLGGPDWFHVWAHQAGMKVWQPGRPKDRAKGPATRPGPRVG